jgi:hypothetical protein
MLDPSETFFASLEELLRNNLDILDAGASKAQYFFFFTSKTTVLPGRGRESAVIVEAEAMLDTDASCPCSSD